MKNALVLGALLAFGPVCMAQQAEKFPLGNYQELTDTKPHDDAAVWDKLSAPTSLSWGTTDVRYKKLDVPAVTKSSRWQAKAWKGERVNAQAVLWTKEALEEVSITASDLKNGSSVIPSSLITTHFVRYVMTDELNKDGKGGCGHRENKAEWDSSIVADVLDIVKILDVQARTTQPLWMNVQVPSDARPGKYKGTLTVSAKNRQPMNLQVEIDVVNRTLPAPKDWQFHLDLWQNPYSVARYYQVPLWSKEHFDAMKPVMKMLADAGQKIELPAAVQFLHAEYHTIEMIFRLSRPRLVHDGSRYDFLSRMKKLDGSWEFDYTVFDKWVEFMMNEVGIDTQINCYTMIPWALTFDYFDQATNRIQFVNAKPGESEYTAYWLPFLKDFSRHLREKGWFDKTTIAMDERPMEAMREAIKVIKQADADFKISLAGTYHPEIEADLYDYCIAYGGNFPAEVKARREKEGKLSTVYTCCAEAFPNTFTFSAPAEAAWTAIHATAGNYDGYLRWAVNSWTADPLRDSRFRTWAAGDCYSIYPGPRSSIRFERLVEGIQDCEKIRILRQELTGSKLEKLNKTVAKFTPEGMAATQQSATEMVNELTKVLDTF